jgi:electron transfer flavoprotein beta subunit
MRIGVLLRLVPDLGDEFEIADDGKDLNREWLDLKLNEFDDHALEEAILLKERTGATVIAFALDGEGVERMLQTALARGVDVVAKIAGVDDRPLSSRESAPLFAAAVAEAGCDLVLTGVQSPEDIHGQLAPYLGAVLGWPHASAVNEIALVDGNAVTAQQEFGGGVAATFRIVMPAVIGVQTASQPIRYVSGSKLRQVASTKPTAVTVGASPGADPAQLVAIAMPEAAGAATMLEGSEAEVADRLLDLFVERGFVKA